MMNSLRRFIESVLVENAETVTTATTRGLALFVRKRNAKHEFVLYDPGVALKIAERYTKDIAMGYNDSSTFVDAMRGFIVTEKPQEGANCNGAHEVISSAAVSGFGPLMYDLAMSYSPALSSDRGSVSKSAEKVWQFYHDKRPDVKKLKFDDLNNPQTPPKEDDCYVYPHRDALNYAYVGSSANDSAALQQKHVEWLVQLEKLGIDEKKALSSLYSSGSKFFTLRYGED